MKTSLYKISIATLALAMLAVSPVFSNDKSKGGETGGKGETLKKEEPAADPQQEKKIEEPGLEVLKSEGGIRQEVSGTKVNTTKSTSTTTLGKPSADLAAERPEENASKSALSFNFVFYVLYKFNLSDI